MSIIGGFTVVEKSLFPIASVQSSLSHDSHVISFGIILNNYSYLLKIILQILYSSLLAVLFKRVVYFFSVLNFSSV